MNLDLTGRQQNILLAIVLDYIANADPVGSRTISKKYELGLSPATIRNDMAELEEKGLLVQPHSSAGRIPSELGYRSFVDFLMEKHLLSEDEVQKIKAINNVDTSNIEFLMEQSARVLSAISNSVSIIQFPEANNEFVKHFQILPLSDTMFVIVLVSNTGKVTDYKIKSDSPVDETFFSHITNYFNEQLVGIPISRLKDKLRQILKNNTEFDDIINIIYQNIGKFFDNKKNKFKFVGTSNLLREPEFIEKNKAHSIIDFFEEEENTNELSEIMGLINCEIDSIGTKILIGKEIKIEKLKDCSIIINSYKIGDSINGAIGILGPTRMHYGKSIAAIEEMSKNISTLLYDIFGFNNK